MDEFERKDRRWGRAMGCLALASISCVPLYFLLTIASGVLSEAEQNYWAAHRTPVRYEFPKGFLGKGEIDFNVPLGSDLAQRGSALVFEIPPSGRLRLRTSYESIPPHVDESVFRGGERLSQRRTNGGDEDRSMVKPVGVGFYRIMNDDAIPASGQDDASRWAFFVGTHEEFTWMVKLGKIKPWE